jgi:hypothetical protein
MALKFIGARLTYPRSAGLISDAIRAIDYAKSKGAKISNNSWAAVRPDAGISKALKDAIDSSDMLFVASAGNDGINNDTNANRSYPAAYDSTNILSVAAIDNGGKVAGFSNFGRQSVDISAPGVSVLSSTPDVQNKSAVTLSSVGSGKALVAGFGIEEINDSTNRKLFMEEAFKAVGHETNQDVVLVDDDGRPSNTTTCINPANPPTNVDSTISAAMQDATGATPTVIPVTCASATSAYPYLQRQPEEARNTTLVWATGKSPYTFFDGSNTFTRNLTPTDRTNLYTFLNNGGKLILTGMDALHLNENDSLVTERLGLTVQPDTAGQSSTKFAGASYALNNSSFADRDLHDVLIPANSSVATPEGSYPGRTKWEYLDGTSMAAPHATGAAALTASVNSKEDNSTLLNNPVALKQAVLDGAKPIPATTGKPTATQRMVDAKAALTKVDKTAPEISGTPSDIIAEATGPSGATVSYDAPTASDAVDGTVAVSCAPASENTFALGETTVTCSATDKAGNKVTSTFKVKVVDTTAPSVKVPSDMTAEATGPSGATVSYDAPTASDAVDGDLSQSVTCDKASGSTFRLGTTKVTCSAKDAAGSTGSGSFNVTVEDTTAPIISGTPSDITKTATSKNGATVTYSSPTATDIVDGSVNVSCTPASGSTFPLGETTVKCSATDEAGNTTEKSFTVKVTYSWSGLLPPVNGGSTLNDTRDDNSVFKLGRTVPVKFKFTDDSAGISDATAKIRVVKLDSSADGTEVEATSTNAPDSGSTFRYDPADTQYIFNWGTKGLTAGDYLIRIDLLDGTAATNTVRVSLK